LRVGAVAAPKRQSPETSSQPRSGKARRIASLSAATAMLVGVAATSAIFVDYLADRALARAAEPTVVKPMVAKALEASAEKKVAALEPDLLMPELAKETPSEPPASPIEVEAPDPEAVAKVAAVGPEHAIELPADDPTASPILQVDEIGYDPFAEEVALSGQPSAMEEDASDETLTAAISPDEAETEMAVEPEQAPKPRKKTAKAKPDEAKPAAKQTKVASLPGVDIGGLAGHPSSDDDNSDSTVRTVTKQAAVGNGKGGGMAPGSARVTAAVNLRSSPGKGSGVQLVVPAGSAVNVISCDGWCQISYNGRTGWIYKNFLTGGKAQKQKAAAKPQKQKAATTAASEDQPVAPPTRKIQSSRL